MPRPLLKPPYCSERSLRLKFQLGRQHHTARCRRACLVREALLQLTYPSAVRDLIVIDPGDRLGTDNLKPPVSGAGEPRSWLENVLTARQASSSTTSADSGELEPLSTTTTQNSRISLMLQADKGHAQPGQPSPRVRIHHGQVRVDCPEGKAPQSWDCSRSARAGRN